MGAAAWLNPSLLCAELHVGLGDVEMGLVDGHCMGTWGWGRWVGISQGW